MHHADEEGIWVIIQKKASQRPGVRYEEAVQVAVAYGWIDGKIKRLNETEFIQRYTPRRRNSVWSQSNRKRAERLIGDGGMTPSGFKAVEEAQKTGQWDKAYSRYRSGVDVPQDLRDALKMNRTAQHNFEAFPPSTRVIYIHWINEAKRRDTRMRRILAVVDRATKNLRPGMRA